MAPIHEGLEYKDFDGNPGGVTSVSVCLDSGKRATDLCARDQRGSRVRTELFIAGTEPSGSCDAHVEVEVNKNNNKLATDKTPKNLIEKRVFIKKEFSSRLADDDKYIVPTEKDDTKSVLGEIIDNLKGEFKLSDLGISIGGNVDEAIAKLKEKGVEVNISNPDANTRTIKALSNTSVKRRYYYY